MKKFNFQGRAFTFNHEPLNELGFISLEKFIEIEGITKSDLIKMGYKSRNNVPVKGVAYSKDDNFYFIGKNEKGETIVNIRSGGINHEQTFSFHQQVKAMAQLKLHDITALLGNYYVMHRKIPNILNKQGTEETNRGDSYAFHIWIINPKSKQLEWKGSFSPPNLRFYDKGVGTEQYNQIKGILEDPLEINKIYAELKKALPRSQE